MHIASFFDHVTPACPDGAVTFDHSTSMAALKRRPKAFRGLLLAALGLPLVLLVSTPQKIWSVSIGVLHVQTI